MFNDTNFSIIIDSSEDIESCQLVALKNKDLYKNGAFWIDEKPYNGDLTFIVSATEKRIKEKYTRVFSGPLSIYRNTYYSDEAPIISKRFVRDSHQGVFVDLSSERALASKVGSGIITNYRNTFVRLEVNAISSGLLFFSDSFSPGWKVTVDSEPTTLLKVNDLFRGVYINNGRHIIEFRYRPEYFVESLWFSAFSFLLLFYFLLKLKNTSLKRIDRGS